MLLHVKTITADRKGFKNSYSWIPQIDSFNFLHKPELLHFVVQ